MEQAFNEILSLRMELSGMESLHSAASSKINFEAVKPDALEKDAVEKMQPTAKTYQVICAIRRGLSNDEVQSQLRNDGIEVSISNIRQVRSRYNAGQYSV